VKKETTPPPPPNGIRYVKEIHHAAVLVVFLGLIVFGCDPFNTPLKEFIEEATGVATGLEWTIHTPHYLMSNGVIAVPPVEEPGAPDEVDMTIILRNPQNYELNFSLKNYDGGDYDDWGYEWIQSSDRQQLDLRFSLSTPSSHGEESDVSLAIEAKGRPMTPYKLPKMQCLYLNADLESLSVNLPDATIMSLNPAFDPDIINYVVDLPDGTTGITISAGVPLGLNSTYTINGIKNSSVTITDLTNGSTRVIPVVVTAECGLQKTYTVTVNMLGNAQAPVITAQPQDATVTVGTAGATYDLNVTASVIDGGTLTYQWHSNTINSTTDATPISGATGMSYAAPIDELGTMYYYVVVTNMNNSATGLKTASTTSSVAELTVNDKVNAQTPNITTHPAGATVNFNASHSLSVAATSPDGGTLFYQWYRNTTNSNTDGTFITGATSATYSPPTNAVGTYFYYVEVTNTISDNGDGGNKTAKVNSSAAGLTVNKAAGAVVNVPTLNDKTHNSISINAVTAPGNGQIVQYAINESSTAPTTGWETFTTFTNLDAGTIYYIFARAAENDNYETGAASGSLQVTTLQTVPDNKFIYYWIDEHDILVISGGTTVPIAVGGTLTISAQDSGYESVEWYLDGLLVPDATGLTYTFSGTTLGKHTVGLFVVKDGKLYNINFTITVQ
jgi:hypothetical protein